MNAPDAMIPRMLRVAHRIEELEGVVTLELESAASFDFRPGQFNMLYAFGVGEIPISLSGDPASKTLIRHTVRAVGQVSHAIAQLGKGEQVGIRGPLGQGWPLELAEGKDLVLAAGGLGLAPLRPVLMTVLRERARFGRVVLYYGTRNPDTLLYAREMERWRQAGIDLKVTVDSATPDWKGEVGVVTRLMQASHFDADNAIALLCGPEVMMRLSAQTLNGLGVAEERIFVSMERNMNCGVGLCGHCQFGPRLVCRDGPVFPWREVASLMSIREL